MSTSSFVRGDLDATKEALAKQGFIYRHADGVDIFLDGPGAKPRDAIHVIFAGEKARIEHFEPAPDPEPFEIAPPFRVLPLESLVRMKLTSFPAKGSRAHPRHDRCRPDRRHLARAVAADPRRAPPREFWLLRKDKAHN